MKKRNLVLSVDYEIFGDGSGDVRKHMIHPTDQMARICEKFDVALTIFFEVEEYLAFVRERKLLSLTLGYDPASEIRAQALELIRRGHDLQLHLHPEWLGAVFQNGQWSLRREMRTVDRLFDTPEQVSKYIEERKAAIDSFYEQVGSNQRVRAFRAGAFGAQPGHKLLWALERNGILIDSSLVRGMIMSDGQMSLDFSRAPEDRRHWRVSADVASEDLRGRVIEIPIHSLMGRRIQQLTSRRLLAKFSSHVPICKQREMVNQLGIGRTPASALRFLGQRFPIKLDFHNMSSGQMLRWIRSMPPPTNGDLDVVILIGHSKEHRDDKNFERFLKEVNIDPVLEVVSLSDVAHKLKY